MEPHFSNGSGVDATAAVVVGINRRMMRVLGLCVKNRGELAGKV
jgi:hypothetical protein